MTWNPLRKCTLQSPTPAQPCLTIAEDRKLDITVQRIIHIETTTRKMIKEMNKYLNSIKQLDSVDQRVTSNLSSCGLVHIDDMFRRLIEEYHSITIEVGKNVQDIIVYFQKTFIEPLIKLQKEFVYIRHGLVKREELVNNWKVAYENFKKYNEKREKTASHLVKLEKERKAEEITSKELKMYHTRLLNDLSMFLEKRVEYLKPTVHALIAIQLRYYGESTAMFNQLMPVTNTSESPNNAMIDQEEYNDTLNQHFNRIRNLTIIKND